MMEKKYLFPPNVRFDAGPYKFEWIYSKALEALCTSEKKDNLWCLPNIQWSQKGMSDTQTLPKTPLPFRNLNPLMLMWANLLCYF